MLCLSAVALAFIELQKTGPLGISQKTQELAFWTQLWFSGVPTLVMTWNKVWLSEVVDRLNDRTGRRSRGPAQKWYDGRGVVGGRK